MDDFIIENRTLKKYTGPGGDVTVPAGVLIVAHHAFRGCSALTSVSFPKGVISIGQGVFIGCPGLEAVSLPESLESIGNDAFRECAGLKSVSLPGGLQSIGWSVFENCTGLETVFLSEGTEIIGDDAFRGCARLKSVSLPRTLKLIGASAFAECTALEALSLSEGLESIRAEAFRGCVRLKAVSMPDSLKSVGRDAFAECAALEALRISSGLGIIDDGVFFSCRSLRSLRLPEGVREVRQEAFSGCGELETLTLPGSLQRISWGAFSGCGSLRSVRFPEPPRKPVDVSPGAFSRCPGIVDGNGFWIVGGTLFRYDGTGEEVAVPEGVRRISDYAMADLPGTVRLSLPASVTSVGKAAFHGSTLVLRVRRWLPDLSRAVRTGSCSLLAICAETDEGIPPYLRRAFRIGFALAPEDAPDTDAARAAMDWLSKNAGELCGFARRLPELLHFLCARRLLRPAALDAWLEEARRYDDPAFTAVLLDYRNTLGTDAMERARERKRRRAEAAAEARAGRLGSRQPEDGIAGLRFAAAGVPGEWMTRRVLQTWLEARGARLGPKITANTDWLIVDETDPHFDGEMLHKADALGVPRLSGEELLAMAHGTVRGGEDLE